MLPDNCSVVGFKGGQDRKQKWQGVFPTHPGCGAEVSKVETGNIQS